MNVLELRDGTELMTFPHEVPKKPENLDNMRRNYEREFAYKRRQEVER